MFSSPSLWFFIILSPIAACLPDTTFQIFSDQKSPKDFHIMQEIEHGWQNNVYTSHHKHYVDQINDFVNEQGMEEDVMITIDDETLSSETILLKNLEDGGSTKSNETLLPKLDNLLPISDWSENKKYHQDLMLNKNKNIENNDYIPLVISRRDSHFKFGRKFLYTKYYIFNLCLY